MSNASANTSAPSKKTLAVVNEHAGGGAMADIFRRLEHPLRDAIGDFDVAFTDQPGHAITIVRKALHDGYRRIIAGGGDGTLNECVNGFFEEVGPDGSPGDAGGGGEGSLAGAKPSLGGAAIAPDAELALLSGGTGGDFRKTVGLKSSEDALAALKQGKTIACDVGRVSFVTKGGARSTRCFINIASFGLSGLVDRNVGSFKQFGGKAAYFGATLKSMWGWKNPRVVLTIDGESLPARGIVTVAIANGKYFGGGMMVCPEARLDSGSLEVGVLGDMSRLELIMMSNKMYSGAHVRHPKVLMRRGKVIDATAELGREVWLDIDGEPLGILPARFEVLPGALNLVVP